ncbi:unnamed protein product [Polarella glacialis]|nr:unnamed protein product [Polarella glacialis]
MDGTLTVANLDFKQMYERCGVDLSLDLLAEISKMNPADKIRAQGVIEEMEAEGARTLQLAPGALELAGWLKARRVPTALVTRNQLVTAQAAELLWRALLPDMPVLSPLISRDSHPTIAAKPDPAALHHIAGLWGTSADMLLMVGDSPSNDVAFGTRAGAATALIDSGRMYLETSAGKASPLKDDQRPDVIVQSLADLPRMLEESFVLDPIDLSR